MTNDDLRALADAIVYRDSLAIARVSDYLRALADAQPVAWLRPENRVDEECTARTRISIGERCPPIGTWRPLYAHPAPAVPAGWKVVPVEPTPEMLDEGCDVDARAEVIKKYAAMPVIRNPENCCSCGEVLAVQYRAMLAAAPAVPQAEPKREPLSDAIVTVVYELAALIPKPDQPTVDDWPCDNPADRLALQIAYTTAREALDGIGGSDAE